MQSFIFKAMLVFLNAVLAQQGHIFLRFVLKLVQRCPSGRHSAERKTTWKWEIIGDTFR